MTDEPVVFGPRWTVRIFYAGFLALIAAFAWLLVRTAEANGTWGSAGALMALPALVGAAMVAGLYQSFTVYRVDDQGITKQSLRGTQSLRWSDVVTFHVDSSDSGGVRLADARGGTLSVDLVALPRDRQQQYRELVLGHLQAQRAEFERGFAGSGRSLRPGRSGGQACFVLAAVLAAAALLPLFAGEGDEASIVGVVFLFLAPALLLLGLGADLLSRRLILTDSLVEECRLFAVRLIRFSRMESPASRTVATRNSVYEVTTMSGEGQAVTIAEQMPDYQLIRDFAREHAAGPAAEKGMVPPAVCAAIRSGRIAWSLLAVLAVAFSVHVGFGVWDTRDARERLARHRLLDAYGQPTQGRVTQRLARPDGRRVVVFRFVVDGRRYEGGSFVAADTYARDRQGQPVAVRYAPRDPWDCRVEGSVGERLAAGDLASGETTLASALWVLLPAAVVYRWGRAMVARARRAIAQEEPALRAA